MTVVRRIRGANGKSAGLGMMMPIGDIVAWHYPGGSLNESVVNHANIDAPATVTGAPTVGAHWLGFKSVTDSPKYLNTPHPDGDEFTLIAVARTSNDMSGAEQFPTIVSTLLSSGGITGAHLGWTAHSVDGAGAPKGRIGGRAYFDNSGTPTEVISNLNQEDVSAFRAYAFTAKTGVGTAVYDLLAGTQDIDASALALAPSGRTWRIGSSYNGTQRYGSCDGAAVVIANKAKELADIMKVYQQLKSYFGRRSITI
ncbi:hypothetical protein [Kumtagia ephedrae]|uniref:Uncharacterized protein n=1 Tax=Kumtagia ephedrae TaxID=2116701 RepID=A0A2P7SPS9_9HYPH|nr:hypothetical protein [Mesorhizobium ephedrae]PSJ64514.1 hypothetical protein C7I84_06110 [Mesorhizobium ephedrae]